VGEGYKCLKTRDEKRESCSEFERREPCAIVYIIEISHIEGEEDDSQFSPIIEYLLIPTQTRSYVGYMTSCVSSRFEVTFEDFSKSLILSVGRQSCNS